MRIHFFGILFILYSLSVCDGKPKIQGALMYLSKYGYLPPNSMGNSSLVNAKTFKNSLMEFQDFVGIPKTGKLDKLTLEVMSSPRCGVGDKIGKPGRSKRYVHQGSRWRTKQLTYKISKYTEKLGREQVDKAIQDALNLWSKYTDLTFERSDRGKIDIRFEVRDHGDNSAFDGPGGTLAHAYFPQFGGATHFDDSEPWMIGAGSGINLYQVAAHEFGHALGLSHSKTTAALMAPYYKRDWTNDLYQDDIKGIQGLYGAKSGGDGGGGGGGAEPAPAPRPEEPPRTPRRRFPSFPGFPNFPRFPSGGGGGGDGGAEPAPRPDEPPQTPRRRFPSFPGFPNFPNFPRFPSFPNGGGEGGAEPDEPPQTPGGGFPSFPGFPNFPNFPRFPVYRRVFRFN